MDNLGAAAIFAFILAVLNAIVRPVLQFFALPLTCLTLGFFHFVINAAMFGLASFFVRGVNVEGFWGGLRGGPGGLGGGAYPVPLPPLTGGPERAHGEGRPDGGDQSGPPGPLLYQGVPSGETNRRRTSASPEVARRMARRRVRGRLEGTGEGDDVYSGADDVVEQDVTSGCRLLASRMASWPSAASPTTSRSGSLSRAQREGLP